MVGLSHFVNTNVPASSYVLGSAKTGTNVRQKTDSGSIQSPLFFNKLSAPKSAKKDVPDYQAHLKYYGLSPNSGMLLNIFDNPFRTGQIF